MSRFSFGSLWFSCCFPLVFLQFHYVLPYGLPMVFIWFLMILASSGGLGGSRRAILGPMLGDVGCKMGPRWVQEAFESEFLAQLGVLMGVLAPRWQDKASRNGSGVEEVGGSWRNLEEVGSAGVGGVVQQGGGDLKIPELDSEV